MVGFPPGKPIFCILEAAKKISEMKNTAALLLFLSTAFSLQGQEAETRLPLLALKASPFGIANINVPTLMAGAEIWPLENVGIYLEYGFPANFGKPIKGKLDWHFKRMRASLRYYFTRDSKRAAYIGIGMDYVPQSYRRENDYVRTEDGTIFSYTSSKIQKDLFSTLVSGGFQLISKDKFLFEIYFGLGSKKRKIKHNIAPNGATEIAELPFEEWFGKPDRHEGTTTLPHVDMGFKIGYTFARRN